ncbi:hypothetical protein AB0I60_18705 [Actinosynnema sp. NPDC050436]|uniref:hypothetical protein n=1 Tax=Actinosynnema sp. NPDC050436 TaxID=3155659 RepID=UPI0033EBB44B
MVSERDHLLVAFDGPIAELPRVGDDPFEVVAHAAEIGPATARAVYAQLCRIEYEIVAGTRPAPGVHAAAGTRVTVVTALDVAAVRSFLVLHGPAEHVRHVVGRAGPDPAVLPPAPDLVALAVNERAVPVESCLFVGGGDDDLAAARAAGVRAVRHRRVPATPGPVEPSDRWFDALSEVRGAEPVAARRVHSGAIGRPRRMPRALK